MHSYEICLVPVLPLFLCPLIPVIITTALCNTFYNNVTCVISSTVHPLIIMIFVLQDGLSPVHIASSNGHLGVVKTLVTAGADVNQLSKVSTVSS